MNHHAIATTLFGHASRPFSVELWDGTVLLGAGASSGSRLVVRSKDAIADLVPPVDEDAVARAFARGGLDIVGDTASVIEAIARWNGPPRKLRHLPLLFRARLAAAARGVRERASASTAEGRHSVRRDALSVRHHYDVSDEFFRLFLDESMTYSCAYFPTGRESLAQAQDAKLELIERKLALARGDHLLDIGCGWGGLMLHAARRWGVDATGATISENQFKEATKRASGVDGVHVYQRDYRELPGGPFNKVVSVGMMEHVGRENLDRYFAEVHRRMAPGALFLNHAIADIAEDRRTVAWMKHDDGGFIQRHIFPDSDLPPLGLVVRAAERQGFEVRDVESLREHYAQTLAAWLMNLEAHFDEAAHLVTREVARMWRLYLGASCAAFRLGKIGVYQVLLAKRRIGGTVQGVPRCRTAWYEPFAVREVAA